MIATIRGTQISLGYDNGFCENVSMLNKQKRVELVLYVLDECLEPGNSHFDATRPGPVGDVVLNKNGWYHWLLQNAVIKSALIDHQEYRFSIDSGCHVRLDKYKRVVLTVEYSRAWGGKSEQLLRREVALSGLLSGK